ncbi:FYDLN acid domain-containing protein [Sandaracinobacteroides saxicola]|uniref:FYDLN acid domain-containing protein n=1 Tax=Sandaracinobacteroides saxicola TaxID=2759707 RepID=A0A7G5IJN6_9SPHN|nr:FYDLN acid domain-containing protein [Sandaracinobacteroides saxicola]QMW23578.1 FYDLN acid domain-containing protein [Sandaracinobacteroides saxicola]
MVKAEWGSKRNCPKCGTRFYDLTVADPVTCINCGHAWVPEPILKSKQTLPFEAAKPEAVAAEGADLSTDDLDLDADNEEPSDEHAVDIGGDDDLSEVVSDNDDEER